MVTKWLFMSQKFSFSYKIDKNKNKKNVFYLIVFDPIKINTHLAPQNVHQIDINVVCKKMTFHFWMEMETEILCFIS